MTSLARFYHAVPGNIDPEASAIRRVELLAEDYDRYRTREAEIGRILDRAGIPKPEGRSLAWRVEQLRLRRPHGEIHHGDLA
jgi:hypothetical protein